MKPSQVGIGLCIVLLLYIQIPTLALGSPDIEIISFEVAPSAIPGEEQYIEYVFWNNGNFTSGPLQLTYYLSSDDTLSPKDIVIAQYKIRSLNPGEERRTYRTESIPKTVPLAMYYPILEIVPTQRGLEDANLDNNIFVESQIEITNSRNLPREWVNKKVSELLFLKTNEERELRKRAPLVYNDMLAAISQGHTDDMAERDYFDHLTPEGKNPHDRAREYGFPHERVREDGSKIYGIGENIARFGTGKDVDVEGFGYVNQNDPIQLATVALTLFLNSASHKETLLSPLYREIGISATLAKDGQYYIGQNLG
ncbi:MAG: CAP domain-containing protein [Methanomicrobiales archaeon]|jgi:uncharacterized protein YkwD|nr:CAP domain-containing protein [Methanomicrobiales archaeon]